MAAEEQLSPPAVPPAAASPAGPGGDAADKAPTDWWSEARGILLLILAVLGVHSLIAKPFYIPSESMMPTLMKGDRLIVSKYPYGYSFISPTFHILPFIPGRLFGRLPERGDIVIVYPPQGGTDYIKRVIGLPGDKIEVNDGVVSINDVPVKRVSEGLREVPVDPNATCDPVQYPGALATRADGSQVCRLPIYRETLPNGRSYDTIDMGFRPKADNFGAIRVPEGRVFLMGDNRDNSADSRFKIEENGLGGPVPWENIGGRAEFITFSFDGAASWNPFTWWGSLREGRAGKSLRPDKDGGATGE